MNRISFIWRRIEEAGHYEDPRRCHSTWISITQIRAEYIGNFNLKHIYIYTVYIYIHTYVYMYIYIYIYYIHV